MIRAKRAWDGNDVGRVLEELEGLRPKQPGASDPRGWEWHYLNRLCHSDLQTFRDSRWLPPGQPFSPDGKLVCTVLRSSHTVKLTDVTTGKDTIELVDATNGLWANSVAFSRDGQRLACSLADGTIRLWDTTTGKKTLTITGHEVAGRKVSGLCVAFSPDGKRLAAAYDDQTIIVWDATTGQAALSLKRAPSTFLSLQFSSDGKRLVSILSNRSVKTFSAITGEETQSFQVTKDFHLGATSHDGMYVTGTSAEAIKIWHISTGKGILIIAEKKVNGVAFSPDGKRLASGSVEGVIKVWDARDGKELLIFKGHAEPVWRVAFSPNGKRLASYGSSREATPGTEKIWNVGDAANGQDAVAFSFSPLPTPASSRDLRYRAGISDKALVCWDTMTGLKTIMDHPNRAVRSSLALSHYGSSLAAGLNEGEVKVWDRGKGKLIRSFKLHNNEVQSVAYSPDGKYLATGSISRRTAYSPDDPFDTTGSHGKHRDSKNLMVWDVKTGKELWAVDGGYGGYASVTYSPDGSRLAAIWDEVSGTGRRGEVRDAMSGKKSVNFVVPGTPRIERLEFSADGKRLIGNSGSGKPKVWDGMTGNDITDWIQDLKTRVPKSPHAAEIAYTPDGTRMAIDEGLGTLTILDSTTYQEIITLKGHKCPKSGRVSKVLFSPDGNRLASMYTDGTVMVWDGTPLPERKP